MSNPLVKELVDEMQDLMPIIVKGKWKDGEKEPPNQGENQIIMICVKKYMKYRYRGPIIVYLNPEQKAYRSTMFGQGGEGLYYHLPYYWWRPVDFSKIDLPND